MSLMTHLPALDEHHALPFTAAFSISALSVFPVAFKIYDVDEDGLISSQELFRTLQGLVGAHYSEAQLEQVGWKGEGEGATCRRAFSGLHHLRSLLPDGRLTLAPPPTDRPQHHGRV